MRQEPSVEFKETIYWLVWHIPKGRCVTYGQLALAAGSPRASRIVGGIAHYGPSELPWHRVVRKSGSLANGYPGGIEVQKMHLQSEGVVFDKQDAITNFDSVHWQIPQALIVPLIVLVGQTASGKSDVGMRLAKKYNGSIIAADAWTVRKKMDIGTAKPSEQDRASVPHYLLDIVEPDEPFSVSQFQESALEALSDICTQQRIPILVGGNGLYVDSLLYGYRFRHNENKTLHKKLQSMNIEQMQIMVKKYKMSINNSDFHNKRRLSRLLETHGEPSSSAPVMRPNTLVIGIALEKEDYEKRVEERTRTMLANGLENEVKQLVDQYGWDIEALKGIGYKEFKPYFENEISEEDLVNDLVHSNLAYAKRQKTWFKRDKNIRWLHNRQDIVNEVNSFLKRNHV